MTLGRIHSVESFGTVDGPGIRYIAFMQGCLMRCQYCHNRDTWDLDGGKEVSVDEIMSQVISYQPFLDASGGGITASGGEAILQAQFVSELFKACKSQGIHTCLDTNGFVRKYEPVIDELLDNTDLVLLDIKQMDDAKHIELTKVSNHRTLQFAQYLTKRNIKTWIRYVVVAGFTEDVESAIALAEFIKPMSNVEKVELLPYHPLGEHKWQAFGETYTLADISPPSTEIMQRIQQVFVDRGINATF
ncbi:MAG: pyruvate formate lyase 1-activating protein [Shewanella sp.]|jgi:pyruvate formate lyase activating enzyme|uniref:pyruvate formate lyase 1-activating protein n=1 Tax=unclassified Shewanella TaxID=196818 RepID=UPI000C334502|nr:MULTISPECIES: pyruvate formate lyase 1-activating protein [unclassified Shewanella]MBB1364048.1 pyruvate formate lyase 1-activating protein [Shewanella sp. SR44-4]MBO1896719.1 pyruvate formate lyase 1-activating protein [Shewanella sp. BF02_Schw]PKH29388.1 pyruvate formate lyase-activating protein [Shewanella sp. ALD9]